MRKTFYDLFPTPKFIGMQSVGLSLQNDMVCFVGFGKGRGGEMVLKSYGMENLPPSILENGEIKDSKKLIEILSDFRKKYDLYYIKATLPEEKSFLFRTTFPKMPKEEIKAALHFKVEENVPLSADEAIFDFYSVLNPKKKEIMTTSKEGGEGIEVVVSVISKSTVLSYLEVFKASGMQPMLFEVESQAVARAVVLNKDKRSFLIANIKSRKISLYIVSRGFVRFTSDVIVSSDYFSGVTHYEKKEEIAGSDSEAKIVTKSTDGEDILKAEVWKLLDYWDSFSNSQSSGSKIEKVIICGNDTPDFSIKNYFNSILPVPVEQANVWTNIFSLDDYIPDLIFKESFKYSAAIGLALPESRDLTEI